MPASPTGIYSRRSHPAEIRSRVQKVPAGGQLRSPLVATKVPALWPEKSPPLTEHPPARAPGRRRWRCEPAPLRTKEDSTMKSVREHMDIMPPTGRWAPTEPPPRSARPRRDREAFGRGRRAPSPRWSPSSPHNYDSSPTSSPRRWRDEGAHLGQAPPAGGEGRRLHGLRPQLPPPRGRGEGQLAIDEPPWPAPGHLGPGRHPGVRLGEFGPLRLLRRARLEPLALRGLHRQPRCRGDPQMLAECFERIGGVPNKALTDRMGCLKGGVVAGLVIPTPAYVASRPTTASGRTSARLRTPSRRASSRTSSAT